MKQGPKRQAWERLKQQADAIDAEVLQFNRDLASYNENNPDGIQLPVRPLKPFGPLPSMPRWGE